MIFAEVSLLEQECYTNCDFTIKNTILDSESIEYNASSFLLNEHKIIYRKSKETPKKMGQFVTFWKRSELGPIEPYNENNDFDFFVINCSTSTDFGQFVFPKAILIKKGIISSAKKEGKRGFRVYPSWDLTVSKQAQKTQAWQNNYFVQLSETMHIDSLKKLYLNK